MSDWLPEGAVVSNAHDTTPERDGAALDAALTEACRVLKNNAIGEWTTDPDHLTEHTVDEWRRWFIGRAAAAIRSDES